MFLLYLDGRPRHSWTLFQSLKIKIIWTVAEQYSIIAAGCNGMDKNYVYGDFLVSAHSHNAPNLLKIVAPRPDEGLKNLKSTFFEMFSNGVKPKVYFL